MDTSLERIHHLAEIEDYKTLLRIAGSRKAKPFHLMSEQEQIVEAYFLRALNELGAHEIALRRHEKSPELIKQKYAQSLFSIYGIPEEIENALSQKDFVTAKYKIDRAFAALKYNPSFRTESRLQGLLAKYHILTKNYDLARKHLALASYYEDDLRLIFTQGLLHFFEKNELSEDWLYLITYPAGPTAVSNSILQYTQCPKKISVVLGEAQDAKLIYDLFHETKTQITESGSHPSLGFDLVDRAIIYLTLTKKFGISQLRLQETLWPNEYFSLLQSTQKIGQLVTRLRKKGFKIIWKNLRLKLEGGPALICHWSAEKGITGGCFLKLHPSFTREMMQKHFCISKTSALTQISKWLTDGCIRKTTFSKGFLTQYEFIKAD